jgi:hypothetical protein
MYRTFTKSLSVAKVEELMRTDRFKYVTIQAGGNDHFEFDLLDEIERGCIFALIHTRDSASIDGWLVSKNLPEWVGDYSQWLTYKKLHTNSSRSHHKDYELDQWGKEFSIPGSISYSGGFDSDEGKGSSEGCSAAYQGLSHKTSIDRSWKFISIKVPVAHKQNLSDDSSDANFLYDELTKHAEKEYLASRSGNRQKTYFSSSGKDDKSKSDEGSIPVCDWANEGWCFPGMVPIKCQFSRGCNIFVHHLCTIQWAIANNVDEGGIATLCKEHHHVYQHFSEQCSTLNPKPNWKTGSGNCPSSSNARRKDEEYLSRKDNDYNELNQVRSKSKEDDFKKSTSDNKSGGTFDNTENCGLNVEFDKEKNHSHWC